VIRFSGCLKPPAHLWKPDVRGWTAAPNSNKMEKEDGENVHVIASRCGGEAISFGQCKCTWKSL